MSVGCLKSCIKFGSSITLIAAIMSFAFGGYILWVTNSDKALFIDKAQVFKNLLVYGIFFFGALLFFASVFGLYGAKKKSSCCLFLFQIFTILLAVTGFALGLASTIMGQSLLSGNCYDVAWSAQISQVSQLAQTQFCYPDQTTPDGVLIPGCQCAFNPSIIPPDVDPKDYENFTNVGNATVINYPLCNFADPIPNELLGASAFLDAAEQIWGCAGWCDGSPLFLFSDVNRGIPDGDCYPQVKDFFHDKGNLLSYAFFAVAVFLTLLSLIAVCLCCSSDQKNSGKSYYHRMRVYDD